MFEENPHQQLIQVFEQADFKLSKFQHKKKQMGISILRR